MAPLIFHPFPLLPKELRIIIWHFSLPSPRIIQPHFTQLTSLNQYGFAAALYSYTTILFSLPLSTDISAVNAEARGVFYAAYKSIEALDVNHSRGAKRAIVDFDRDTIFLFARIWRRRRGDGVINWRAANERVAWAANIQSLALDWNAIGTLTLESRARTIMYLVNVLEKFPVVRKVDFVVGVPRLEFEPEPELFLLGKLGRETKMEVEVHAWVELWDEVGIPEEVREVGEC